MRTKKKLLKRHFSIILLLLFITFKGASQSEPTVLSSRAWGLQNVNIDLFRGRMSLSVPITVFNSKHLSHQISMSYTPYDINSTDNSIHPGYYGLGWTLNAGGVITRTVKELPDEESNKGNFNNLISNFDPKTFDTHRFIYETEEDEFSFSFCGYTGTFFFYRGEWHFFSDVEFKVKSIDFNNHCAGRTLHSFVLVGPDATTYSFGGNNATEFTLNSNNTCISSAWYLTKIRSVEGDEIFFEYSHTNLSEVTYVTNQVIVESKRNNPEIGPTGYSLVSKLPTDTEIASLSVYRVINPLFLKKIYSNNPKTLEIEFATHPTSNNRLHEIIIKNTHIIHKKFSFDYYLTSGEFLKLKSIQENAFNLNGTMESIPQYLFEYKPPNDPVAPQVLYKLTYPMGGYSTFIFEPNIYTTFQPYQTETTIDNIQYFRNDFMQSGFRISEQKTYSSNSEVPIKLRYYYCYDFPNLSQNAYNSSTGIMTEQPMKERFEAVAWGYGFNYIIRKQASFNLTHQGELRNKTITSPMLGYSSVWVVQSNDNHNNNELSIGYTNYRFSNYIENIFSSQLKFNDINEAGKLLKTIKYDSNKQVLYSEENFYESVVKKEFKRYYLKVLSFIHGSFSNFTEYRYGGYTSHKKINRLSRRTTAENSIWLNYIYHYDTNDNLSEMKISEQRLTPEVLYSNIQINDLEDEHYYTTSIQYRYIEDFNDINIDTYNQYNIMGDALIAKKIPVERVVRKNGKVVAAEFIKFKPIGVNYIVRPYQIYSLEIKEPIDDYQQPDYYWNNFDSRLKLKTTFTKYDQAGNLLEYQNIGETPTAYFYENSYDFKPSIVAFNCTYDDIKNISNMDDDLINLYRKNLSESRIFSYKYNYNWDILTTTSPNGTKTQKEYDSFGRLKSIKDNNGKIIKAYTYSYSAN